MYAVVRGILSTRFGTRKEFDERLKEWLQTVEKSPDEMLVSSRGPSCYAFTHRL